MGYCPQTSALIASLNARDHLKLFALLRGVPKRQVTLEVEKWINRLSKNTHKLFIFFLFLCTVCFLDLLCFCVNVLNF